MRKGSLQENLYDTFTRITHTSDPEILEILQKSLPKKTSQPMSPEVTKLLLITNDSGDSNSSSDSDLSVESSDSSAESSDSSAESSDSSDSDDAGT